MTSEPWLLMPTRATPGMVDSMNAVARAMLDAVGKIDVGLIYATAVQHELSRLALAEAGMDERGQALPAPETRQ
jgi:hypothetical protein